MNKQIKRKFFEKVLWHLQLRRRRNKDEGKEEETQDEEKKNNCSEKLSIAQFLLISESTERRRKE